MGKSLRQKALPIIGTVIGAAVGGPPGAAIGSGLGSLASGRSPQESLLSAGGTYLGSNLAGNVLGDMGTVGGSLNSAFGTSLGSTAANALPSAAAASLFDAPISSIIGSQVGSSLASSLVPQTSGNVEGEGAMAPFRATREGEKQAPLSIQGLGSLTPEQVSTNIATGGVYGGGQGPDEQDYFLNMVNRRLVDDAGNVDSDLSEINPIENSYLSQLGLGGYGNAQDLLEALSRRRAAA